MCIYNRIEYIHKINTLEKMEDATFMYTSEEWN